VGQGQPECGGGKERASRRAAWAGLARALRRTALAVALAPVKKVYEKLKDRYGPRYTKALLLVVFVSFFSPLPGSTLAGVALVVAAGEFHRAVARRGGFVEAATKVVALLRANVPFWVPGQWPSPCCWSVVVERNQGRP
jgi:hypothetical protein